MQSADMTLSPTLAQLSPTSDDLSPSALDVLDERDEWLEFSQPLTGAAADTPEDGVWESWIAFEGMTCAACAVTIEQILRAAPGVQSVEVSAAGQRGRVVWDEHATRPSRWMQTLAGSGYRALPVHDVGAAERRQAASRRMLWRLGVAGLCMMQVMMYAVPVYVTAPGTISPEMVRLLRWAQWVLALPVVVFSCQPFFAAAWRDLRRGRISMDLPVALGMAITFVVSSLGTFEPAGRFGHEVYFDSLTMFAFFLLAGRWLELRLRDRAAGALEALMHRLPQTVDRRDANGDWQEVSTRRIRAGDVLRVRPGDVFAADGQLLSGQTTVDEALLTGESRPVARGVGESVVAGSHNLSALIEMRAEGTGAHTRYAQIVALMTQAASSKPDLARLADRVAKPFLIFVLVTAATAAAWWWHIDPARAAMIAVAVLVVTCPCALSLATPAAMLASAGALAKRGVLVRRLQAIESLASVNTVVFDKTGTLTRDAFVLDHIDVRADASPEQALASAGLLGQHSLHPISRALASAAPDAAGAKVLEAQEIAGQGVQARVGLADGSVCQMRLGSARFCGVVEDDADERRGPQAHMADDAGWLASFEFQEDLRADAQAAVTALHDQGLSVQLLSGDQTATVERIGTMIGIDQAMGSCTPDNKWQRIRALHETGARTAMVGDGLNDGPVLAAANVSFAFGRAVPLAQAQSDFVVLGDRLMLVAQTRQKALETMRVVRQNLGWALLYNVGALPLAVSGWMPAWAAGLGMATSSLVVVANALRLNRGET